MGALVVSRNGERITHFPTEKVGLLLAYLAVFPQTIQLREELAERFWPESKPEDGRVSLRQALASLRRLLEPPEIAAGTVLIADRYHIQLNPDAYHTDLALWDHMRALADQANTPQERLHWLEETARSYRGALLPGVYMEWALAERQRRQDQHLEVMLHLIDAYMEGSDYTPAIANAQRLLQIDPLHEEAHERLMRLFAAQGKLGLARRQYRQLCRLLRDELNLEPDPRIQKLHDNLKQFVPQRSEPATTPGTIPVRVKPVAAPVTPLVSEILPRLPLRLTRFFGREAEIDLLHRWLNDPTVRLATLTGMGGVGKTRLALEAVQQTTRFGAALTFVPLSDTQDPALLLPTILQALGMPAIAPSDPLTRLVALLGTGPHLLVLDNFEQIANQADETVWQLLERAPGVVCLITSRQALNLPGEHELALPPLPVPATHLLPKELIANPTVQLLVDRMRSRRPNFQVTSANAGAVATLCARLEGIPLAVELAAGWARPDDQSDA
jgi:DNA-binding SARP family transcriptional activator